jgi:hypothetical protein
MICGRCACEPPCEWSPGGSMGARGTSADATYVEALPDKKHSLFIGEAIAEPIKQHHVFGRAHYTRAYHTAGRLKINQARSRWRPAGEP